MRLHEGAPLVEAGVAPARAQAALVALHGRGATAEGILELVVEELGRGRRDVAFLAPQARHGTWYPKSFLAPLAENQPWLDSALERLAAVLRDLGAAGVPAQRILLFGFSQGACLATEFVARNPRRYGALVAAVGGRIGPPGSIYEAAGDLAGTPVLFAAGDPDPHVPWERVEASAANFTAMGARVETLRLPGFPHAVPPAALAFARAQLAAL
jgi:predicted esterase